MSMLCQSFSKACNLLCHHSVVLRCLSRNAWEYIMALTLMGVRHLISPRWLEKM